MKKPLLTAFFTIAIALSTTACNSKTVDASVDATPASVSTASLSDTVVSASEASEVEPETEPSVEPETEPAAQEICFLVQDVFTITYNEIQYTVLTGTPVGGTLCVDDTLIFESDGERTETKVISFETVQGEHPTSAGEGDNVAVWIDQYLSQTIKSGDKLVDATAIK